VIYVRVKQKQTNKQNNNMVRFDFTHQVLIVLKWVLHIRMEPDLKEFSNELR